MYTKIENNSEIAISIENNFKGLYDYLTASNIRHKVKHPLFLFFKFYDCVKLFYNQKLFP